MKDWRPYFIGILFGILFGDCLGCYVINKDLKADAIKHNAASYVCNPQTGETVFKWKDEQ